ncbi:hypothetical protein CA983_42780, partial [Streptomyces swartbergensis]
GRPPCPARRLAAQPCGDPARQALGTEAAEIPLGRRSWTSWTFWQYDNGSGSLPGDQNLFDGSLDRLKQFVRGA